MANERKNNLFKHVPVNNVKRSLFDLSHEVKMSGKFGFLYPVLCIDTLPGDTIRDTMNVMVRMAPMLAPIMHRLDVTTHFFFVPNRLVTDHWEDFITGGQDGTEAPVLPYLNVKTIAIANAAGNNLCGIGSLWDYLGLPPNDQSVAAPFADQNVSALPFRACAKIWNDYYRDPNFDPEFDLDLEVQGDVSTGTAIMEIGRYRRMYEKDYFTSALPFAQRGAQVLMPLAGVAQAGDVTYLDTSDITLAGGAAAAGNQDILTNAAGTKLAYAPNTPIRVENIEEINFDNASTTINDFRRALAIQRWLENNARGGARYTEQIQSHFNVQVPDYRLQRAEYLGGGRQPVQISEVLQTAESGSVGVGDMFGHGLSVGRTNQFTYRCQEHGFVIGFLSVTYRTAYSQGITKMWSRENKYDFGWPELANLGEQEILSKEIYYDYAESAEADNEELFGYIPRYSEYKFHNDRIAGDFRNTLSIWHLGRYFIVRPTLDEIFTTLIEDDGDTIQSSSRRIFQVQDGTDYLWFQLYHHLTAKRPLPYFGVPSIM